MIHKLSGIVYPFTEDKRKTWATIGQLYKDGIISLEQAVQMLALTDAPEEEIERIKDANQSRGLKPEKYNINLRVSQKNCEGDNFRIGKIEHKAVILRGCRYFFEL